MYIFNKHTFIDLKYVIKSMVLGENTKTYMIQAYTHIYKNIFCHL